MKTIHKAYQFRLKPDVEQGRQFARIAGVCRLVWNLCLEQRKVVYSSRRMSLNSYSQLPDVTILRGESEEHIPEMPGVRSHGKGEPPYPGGFRLCGLRLCR